MSNLRQAAQQALEALEAMQSYAAAERKGLRICDEAIAALKQALAEPEQYAAQNPLGGPASRFLMVAHRLEMGEPYAEVLEDMGLADTDNRGQALAEPEQKPVAYFDPQEKGFYWAKPTVIKAPMTVSIEPLPLYSAPTPRKPLTNAEIDDLWLSPPEEVRNVRFRHTKFARAIERAHGIGEQHE